MYVMLGRPDLSYAMTYFTKICNIKIIFLMNFRNMSYGLKYVKSKNYSSILSAFVDADFVNVSSDKRYIRLYD